MSRKPEAKWWPGKRPAASRFSIQPPPLGCFTKDSAKSKTLYGADRFHIPQRVSEGRFSGASSFASAADLHHGRDPIANDRQLITMTLAMEPWAG
jgi:hypothetical protein